MWYRKLKLLEKLFPNITFCLFFCEMALHRPETFETPGNLPMRCLPKQTLEFMYAVPFFKNSSCRVYPAPWDRRHFTTPRRPVCPVPRLLVSLGVRLSCSECALTASLSSRSAASFWDIKSSQKETIACMYALALHWLWLPFNTKSSSVLLRQKLIVPQISATELRYEG